MKITYDPKAKAVYIQISKQKDLKQLNTEELSESIYMDKVEITDPSFCGYKSGKFEIMGFDIHNVESLEFEIL